MWKIEGRDAFSFVIAHREAALGFSAVAVALLHHGEILQTLRFAGETLKPPKKIGVEFPKLLLVPSNAPAAFSVNYVCGEVRSLSRGIDAFLGVSRSFQVIGVSAKIDMTNGNSPTTGGCCEFARTVGVRHHEHFELLSTRQLKKIQPSINCESTNRSVRSEPSMEDEVDGQP